MAECCNERDLPLIWSVDFNVDPMCSIIAQQQEDRVVVLGELVLRHSNTPAACEAFLQWAAALKQTRPIGVRVYGDAPGDSRTSSASRTDGRSLLIFSDA